MPELVLDIRMVKRSNQAATKVLVQWTNSNPAEVTWKFLFDLHKKFPNCALGDKGAAEERNLMRGIQASAISIDD